MQKVDRSPHVKLLYLNHNFKTHLKRQSFPYESYIRFRQSFSGYSSVLKDLRQARLSLLFIFYSSY